MKNPMGIVKAAVPVVLGVVIAGYLMNMFRDNEHIAKAIDGYDA